MDDAALLRRAAARAEHRSGFLASALLPYARADSLNDLQLASHLGCRPGELPLLLLCRRPGGEGLERRAAVEALAARFGLDPVRLADVLRLADAVDALSEMPAATGAGLLAAARDREAEP